MNVHLQQLKFIFEGHLYHLLSFAMMNYAAQIINFLIDKKFNLNVAEVGKCNAFHWVVSLYKKNYSDPGKRAKCLEIAKILLKSDIDKNARNSHKLDPMNILVMDVKGSAQILDMLNLFLENGVVFDKYNSFNALNNQVKIDIRNIVINLNFSKVIESLFDKSTQIPEIYRFDNTEVIKDFALRWKKYVDEVESELKFGKKYNTNFGRLNEARAYLNSQNMDNVYLIIS